MMKCRECKAEVFLDHVKDNDGQKEYWYVCMNPRCNKSGTAFKPTGEETEAKIKPAQ